MVAVFGPRRQAVLRRLIATQQWQELVCPRASDAHEHLR
jgi:hypothetical protein